MWWVGTKVSILFVYTHILVLDSISCLISAKVINHGPYIGIERGLKLERDMCRSRTNDIIVDYLAISLLGETAPQIEVERPERQEWSLQPTDASFHNPRFYDDV